MEQTTTADSKMQGLDEGTISHLIDHIFLPEKVPQDGDVNSAQNEVALLLFVKNAVESFASSLNTEALSARVAQVVNMMKRMVRLHHAMTLEREMLRTVFKEMKDGDIVPLYIQAQNAGLIIRHTRKEVTFESFEVSPKNGSVIECQGRLLCSYPGPIIAIPLATFHNVAFRNELTMLLEAMSEELPTDRPCPTTAKARTEVTEIRDTVMPIYITEFLTGLLRGVGRVVLDRERICKRIADEVLWNNARIPWRRSPLWLVTRVALQTTLFDGTLGVKEAMCNREYKFMMLFIMAKVLNAATQIKNMLGEKLSHMCRKLSRRAAKLGERTPATLLALVNETVDVAGTVLANRFQKIQDSSVRKLQWPPVAGLDVEADTNLTMPNSQAYIKNVLYEYKHPLESFAAIDFNPKHAERIYHQYYSACTLPNKSVLSASGADLRNAVKDIETWVERSLEGFIANNISKGSACRELYSFLTAYVNAAKKDYEGNPLDLSSMLLTTMEIWVAIDRIATATCPLLKEYSCEMTTDILSLLLLPTRSHIDRLNKVELYIIGRQTNLNKNTVFEDGTNITSSSFAVRYYNQSPEHKLLLAEITEKASKTREEKKAEFVRLKQQYDDLMERSRALNHTCWHRNWHCEKCNLQSQAAKIKIDVHEWPLPSIGLEAKAVVVELKLPVAFAAWRDATYEVLANIFNPFLEKKLHDSKHLLQEYQGLSPYFRYQSQEISWASETKSFVRAHYGTREVSMISSESDYLVPNGLKYRLAKGFVGASQWITEALTAAKATQVQNVRKLCTFQLPNASAALQYALNSTDHTSNFSIANQHDCPTEWSLHEYDSFTTLRAGYRLQWLNILREIRAGNLNLNRAETNLLFMQTIWQAGPLETPVTHTRESHSNLRDKDFCSLMLNALTSTLHILKENWLEQISMQNLIELGARLLCLTPFPEIKGLAAKFLRECRNVCMDWMQDMIKRMNSANSDASFEKWQHLALTMAATCRLTFNVDLTDIDFVISSEDDFTNFILCAACVHDNTPPNVRKHPDRHLLDRDARLAHKMEPYLRKLIIENEGWLDAAIKRHWTEYTAGEQWKFLKSPNERWITTTTKGGTDRLPMKVHYNLLEGTFLIDGLPFGRLPKEYVTHPDYFRLFQNRIFSVNKANMPGMSFQMAHSVSVANEHLQVYFTMRQGNLIIRTKMKSEVYEIIPHSKLNGDFPDRMLNSFVHFLHLTDQTLEFRPLKDGTTSLWLPSPSNWRVSIPKVHPNWRAEGTIGTLRLIDYHSPTTQAMNQLFKSIESRSHLELTLSSNKTVNIKLVRYNLDFEFDGTHIQETQIKCRNFPDMVVDVRPMVGQDLGTLYGLKSYLVLREVASTLNSALRIVIIPHGKVRYSTEEHHTSIWIATDTLDPVNYHTYTIDTLLGCLVANGSMRSHLFKIYLHALTAYCLPDPLTGLTGTEQALDHLRCASSWSFQKLNADTTFGPSEFELLSCISKLSPKRTFYPANLRTMQQVEWQASLPSYCQHWEFHSVVNSILQHWERIKVFQVTATDVKVSEGKNSSHEYLRKRASIRGAAYQPSEYGGNVNMRIYDRKYIAREITDKKMESRVCQISSLANNWTVNPKPTEKLASYLYKWQTIVSKTNPTSSIGYRHYWHSSRMEQDWYSLYDFCRKSSKTHDQYKILFVLATLSYRGEDDIPMELVETILAFATHRVFAEMNPPDIPSTKMQYQLEYGIQAKASDIREIVSRYVVDFHSSEEYRLPQNHGESDNEHWNRRRRAYKRRLEHDIDNAVSYYHDQWVCKSLSAPACARDHWNLLNSDSALTPLNERFAHWYHNRLYMQHIERVQVELDTIRPLSHQLRTITQYSFNACYIPAPEVKTVKSLQDLFSTNEPPIIKSQDFRRDIESQQPNIRDSVSHLITRFSNDATGFKKRYAQDLEQSWKSLLKQDLSSQQTSQVILPPLENIESYMKRCEEGAIGIRRHIMAVLCPKKGTIEELLYRAGLRPRITVKCLLSQLAMGNHHHQHTERAQMWDRVLVSFGKSISSYQQAIRLYHHARSQDSIEFNKEWANKGCEGWDPLEYPDWLLFEIENNMLIRPVQAQIASEMLSPPNGANAVMQLNMGEGKSSVIVPIVAAALADKKKLVRVVVLKSLSSQMFHLLVQKLSGLLNRRIYYLPFHRQIELTKSTVNLTQELYQECLDNGGILLSQPEHLLSFKLMGIEKLSAGGPIADSLLSSQRWLEKYSRDILDESDEILHVRYQLIYTIGEQKAPELSPDRWVIIQELFGLVRKHIRELKGRYPNGVEVIEREDAPGSFPFTRLLKKEPESELLNRIAEDVIRRGSLGAVPTRWFTDCMSDSMLNLITKKNVQEPTEWPKVGHMLPYFLLLRGMIAHGILAFVLREKRWRVDYGLALHRTLLAVPYRAKDSPAPRADFGHPDVTIALTCLSYYYQGLEDGQLRMCFECLKKLDNPAAEYLTWIKGCEDLPSPLRQLQGINLEDNDQWSNTIYPRLRLNKNVIDFYLATTVFPKACKEFPTKLTTSGWDLAEEKQYPTTGFSGTNDNRYLLPVSIEQLDLPEQTHTNAKVLRYLLQPENNHYTCAQKEGNERLPVKDLLKKLLNQTNQIQVLLDVGAQVLEMKNHEVAECWLSLASEGKHPWTAVVFFNDDDELTVRSKDGSLQPYMISPYVKNMTTCLVYLDEEHTRGTDLKLPAKSIAAVTLGPKLTKDRLVQACMRMRKLGQGQSVHFFAPPEVHNKLLVHSGKKRGAHIETIDIISWVMHETCAQTERSIALWASQGIGHQTREHAWSKYKASYLDGDRLVKEWEEPESRTLEYMYGISNQQRESVKHIIATKLQEQDLQPRYKQLNIINSRCNEYQVVSLHGVAMQEEQEREVTHEVESEAEVQLPPRATPHTHKLNPAVLEFIKTGIVNPSRFSSSFRYLMDTLSHTSFHKDIEPGPWAQNIIATVDFAETVKLNRSNREHIDYYLRPVTWIVSSVRYLDTSPVLCLLSSFEVNELLPHIRHSQFVNLHMYTPKAQCIAPTFEDLTYAAIPALPNGWAASFPSRDQLMIQVNLFAGQLFFKSFTAYTRTCGFLGIFLRGEGDREKLPVGVETDGFLRGLRNDGNAGPGVLNGEVAFEESPLRFVRTLIGVRRKGMKFGATHIGLLVHGKEIESREWEQIDVDEMEVD